jgi:hypothetical protein
MRLNPGMDDVVSAFQPTIGALMGAFLFSGWR